MISIRIHLNRNDFAQFQKYTLKRLSSLKGIKNWFQVINYLYWCLIAITAVAVLYFYKQSPECDFTHLNVAIIAFSAWFILAIFYQPIYTNLMAKYGVSTDGTVLGDWEIIFTDKSIKEIKEKTNSEFYWDAVEKVEIDKKYVYIFTDIIKGIYIPKEQIGNDDLDKILKLFKDKNKL